MSAPLTAVHDLSASLNELQTLEHAGMRLFALIDAAQPVVSSKVLQQKFDSSLLCPLFANLRENDTQEFGPYLLTIDMRVIQRSQSLVWLLEQEREAPCLTWLVSNQSDATVVAHLQSQLFTHLPSGEEVLLRYYDPRVLETLLDSVLDQKQRRELAGPITHWWLWSANTGRRRHVFM